MNALLNLTVRQVSLGESNRLYDLHSSKHLWKVIDWPPYLPLPASTDRIVLDQLDIRVESRLLILDFAVAPDATPVQATLYATTDETDAEAVADRLETVGWKHGE